MRPHGQSLPLLCLPPFRSGLTSRPLQKKSPEAISGDSVEL
jgi:hypothetical protein